MLKRDGGRKDLCASAWPTVTRVVQSALTKELGLWDLRWWDSIPHMLCGAIKGQSCFWYRSSHEKVKKRGADGCAE